ncbi:hypothetical protein VTN96DRAFT_6808 [Rasamsonia emersonii]
MITPPPLSSPYLQAFKLYQNHSPGRKKKSSQPEASQRACLLSTQQLQMRPIARHSQRPRLVVRPYASERVDGHRRRLHRQGSDTAPSCQLRG